MTFIPSWARVGAKVVCVDDAGGPDKWTEGDGPARGCIYTIVRALVADDGLVDIHLAEIRRGPLARARWGNDVGYSVHRFRPLITQQDDIEAHFRALLDVPVDEREAA